MANITENDFREAVWQAFIEGVQTDSDPDNSNYLENYNDIFNIEEIKNCLDKIKTIENHPISVQFDLMELAVIKLLCENAIIDTDSMPGCLKYYHAIFNKINDALKYGLNNHSYIDKINQNDGENK